MYQFSRLLTLSGSPRQTLPWATEVTAHVNQHSALDVTLWGGAFGHPVGTVAWSTIVESRAALAEATAGLLADDSYMDLVEAGADFVDSPARDVLRQLVHGTPPEEPPGIGAVAATTTAIGAAPLGDVITWGVEMAELGSTVTGANVAFLVDAYGAFGQVTWITVMADMAAADAASEAIIGNADYLAKVAEAGEMFVPGSGQQALLTRLA